LKYIQLHQFTRRQKVFGTKLTEVYAPPNPAKASANLVLPKPRRPMKFGKSFVVAFAILFMFSTLTFAHPGAAAQPQSNAAQKTQNPPPDPSKIKQAPGGGNGKVWVNTETKVYHMEGDEWYGKTKHGKYMTEDEAKKAGYHKSEEDTPKASNKK
jgi:hypothetical protein